MTARKRGAVRVDPVKLEHAQLNAVTVLLPRRESSFDVIAD